MKRHTSQTIHELDDGVIDGVDTAGLSELSGQVVLEPCWKDRWPLMLRISNSPGLRALDLRRLPAGIWLDLDQSIVECEIRLPKGGMRLAVTCSGPMPRLLFRGDVECCLVHCLPGHRTPGHYLLGKSAGLCFLSGESIRPIRGVSRYLRIDQSSRGLQQKTLRRGVGADQVLWSLSSCPKDSPLSRLPGLSHSQLRRLALSTDPGDVEDRLDLLSRLSAGNEQFATNRVMSMDPLDALFLMCLRGHDPHAIWASRCCYQAACLQHQHPEDVVLSTANASPLWGRHFRRNTRRRDLALYRLCERTCPTSTFNEALRRIERPSPLLEVIRFFSRRPAEGLSRRTSFDALTRLVEIVRGNGSEYSRVPFLHGRVVEEATLATATMKDEACWELARQLAEIGLATKDCIRLGIRLLEAGHDEGRELIASGLGEGKPLPGRLRARALRRLLGPARSEPNPPAFMHG